MNARIEPPRPRRRKSPARAKRSPRQLAGKGHAQPAAPRAQRGRSPKADPYSVLAHQLKAYAAALEPLPKPRPRGARRPQACSIGCAYYEAREGEAHWFPIPALRLRGKWLEDIGFAAGSKVRVEVQPGLLQLRLIPPDPVEPQARQSTKR